MEKVSFNEKEYSVDRIALEAMVSKLPMDGACERQIIAVIDPVEGDVHPVVAIAQGDGQGIAVFIAEVKKASWKDYFSPDELEEDEDPGAHDHIAAQLLFKNEPVPPTPPPVEEPTAAPEEDPVNA
jgi:hypothetical protein